MTANTYADEKANALANLAGLVERIVYPVRGKRRGHPGGSGRCGGNHLARGGGSSAS
jgi:hypothetical protein